MPEGQSKAMDLYRFHRIPVTTSYFHKLNFTSMKMKFTFSILLMAMACMATAQQYKMQTQDIKINYTEADNVYGAIATYRITYGFESKKQIKIDAKLVNVDQITFGRKPYPFTSLPEDAKKIILGNLDFPGIVTVSYSLYNDNQFLSSGTTRSLLSIDWRTIFHIHSENSLNDWSEADKRSEELWNGGKLNIKIDKTELFPGRLFVDFGDWLARHK